MSRYSPESDKHLEEPTEFGQGCGSGKGGDKLDLSNVAKAAEVKSLTLSPSTLKESSWPSLERFRSLERLRLCGSLVSRLDLAVLQQLPQLRFLNLPFTSLGDKQLTIIAKLKRLRGLDIRWTDVTDSGLEPLHALHALERLSLVALPVDKGLRHIQDLRSLRELNLSQSALSDQGAIHLAKLPGLTRLDVHATKITDRGIRSLTPLRDLQYLDVSYNRGLTDEGFRTLFGEKLIHFDASFTHLGDESLSGLGKCRFLRSLDLAGTSVTNEGLVHIKNLGQLESLSLTSTGLDVGGLKLLSSGKLRNLKRLEIGWSKVTDSGLELLPRFHALEKLSLKGLLIDEGLRHIQGLSSLRELDVSQSAFSDKGARYVAKLRGLTRLECWETKITDQGIKTLAPLRDLQYLNVSYNTRLTDRGFSTLFLEKLSHFDASNTYIGDEGLSRLRKSAFLRSLNLAGTSVTNEGLVHIRNLERLESLELSSTAVDVQGMKLLSLGKLRNLTLLYLNGTKVRRGDVKRIERWFPKAEVFCIGALK